MTARQINDSESTIDTSINDPDNTSKASLSTKLERRRRIEDIDEERRLREELTEF